MSDLSAMLSWLLTPVSLQGAAEESLNSIHINLLTPSSRWSLASLDVVQSLSAAFPDIVQAAGCVQAVCFGGAEGVS